MTDNRMHGRALCADLVKLVWIDGRGQVCEVAAVLEDISPRGACLQVEVPVPVGIEVHISHGDRWGATCRTAYCLFREIGYFIGVEFHQGESWDNKEFNPQHLLDLNQWAGKTGNIPASN